MTRDKETYGAQYLYSENLLVDGAFKTVHVEISQFYPGGTLKSADGRLIDKPTLEFVGKGKLLVLCKTNASILHFITGQQPGPKWVGVTITLQVRIVDAFGQQVPAIRVMPPNGCQVRHNLIKRLGKKAEWVPTTTTKKETADAGQH